MGRVEDEESVVFRQLRRRQHPTGLLLEACASGHRPSREDFERAVGYAHPGERSVVRHRLNDAIAEIHERFNAGAHQPARTLARQLSLDLAPSLTEYRKPGQSLFD